MDTELLQYVYRVTRFVAVGGRLAAAAAAEEAIRAKGRGRRIMGPVSWHRSMLCVRARVGGGGVGNL